MLRQLTVSNVDNVKKYIFLKNGAMYSIFFLGLIMLKPDGFHLIFQNYQVAPYVVGEPEITIPYDALKDYLSPKYKDALLNPGLKQ